MNKVKTLFFLSPSDGKKSGICPGGCGAAVFAVVWHITHLEIQKVFEVSVEMKNPDCRNFDMT